MADELMPQPRYWRILRITWTAFWGVAAVMLCVLWGRSYWCNDSMVRFTPTFQGIASEYGDLVLMASEDYYGNVRPWQFETNPIGDPLTRAWWVGRRIPFWFPTTLTAALASFPWLTFKRRFSLRTLLIITTLVAVLMGVMSWAQSP